MTYVRPNIVVDEDAIRQQVYGTIQTAVPGWQPRVSSPTTALIEAVIRAISEQRAIFADVPDDIFVALGESILGIQHFLATAATSSVTFTLLLPAPAEGFLIPANTDVVATAPDGVTPVALTTVSDLLIPSGDTAGDALVSAIEPGTLGNGISGDVDLLDGIPGVLNVGTLVAATSGGLDEETLDAYLNRLTRRLQLLSETPILAADFALFAEVRMEELGSPGRALAMDNYNASTDTSGLVKTVSNALMDATGAAQPSGTKTAIDTALQDAREVNFVVITVDPLYTNLTVVVNVVKIASAVSAQVKADVEATLASLLSPASWGGPRSEGEPSWVSRPVVKINDIIIAAGNVPGVQTVTSATLNGGSSDITMQSGKPHAVPQAVGLGTTVTCNVS